MTRTSGPPHRVISLVPSTTGTLFDLGLGPTVVGITDYCIYPEAELAGLPRLGGPKNPDLERIAALEPDLVFVNQEENTQAAVEALQAAGVPIHLSFPCTVKDSLALCHAIAEIFHSEEAEQKVQSLEAELAATDAGEESAAAVFVPVWESQSGGQPWWMTINRGTYTHDILRRAGFANVFADRQRRYPLAADLGAAPAGAPEGRDTRYPRVTKDEILDAAPDVILLPTEPYEYGEDDLGRLADEFAGTPAAASGRISLVDGTWLTWPGTRMAEALRGLRSIATELSRR